ncbi:MAG: hypothetical protein IPH98_08180 [Saprospiraceae bacterium]|nr:hypothetical protein [Candidatus Defluviibacterium haderslevense]
MSILKFILIYLDLFYFSSCLYAQEKILDTNQLPQPDGQLISVDVSNIKFDLDSLNRCITDLENIIKKSKPPKKVELLRQTIAYKDTIINILALTINIKDKIISKKEAEIKIIRFFNIEDTSIFNSKFKNISLSDIPLCLQNHYRLILEIRELDKLLSDVGEKIKKIESEDYIRKLPDTSKKVIFMAAAKKLP